MALRDWSRGRVGVLWGAWLLLLPVLWFGSPRVSYADDPCGGAARCGRYAAAAWADARRADDFSVAQRYDREAGAIAWAVLGVVPLLLTWGAVGRGGRRA